MRKTASSVSISLAAANRRQMPKAEVILWNRLQSWGDSAPHLHGKTL